MKEEKKEGMKGQMENRRHGIRKKEGRKEGGNGRISLRGIIPT